MTGSANIRLVILSMCILGAGCSRNPFSSPSSTLEHLRMSLENGDQEQVMECVTQETRSVFSEMESVASQITSDLPMMTRPPELRSNGLIEIVLGGDWEAWSLVSEDFDASTGEGRILLDTGSGEKEIPFLLEGKAWKFDFSDELRQRLDVLRKFKDSPVLIGGGRPGAASPPGMPPVP